MTLVITTRTGVYVMPYVTALRLSDEGVYECQLHDMEKWHRIDAQSTVKVEAIL